MASGCSPSLTEVFQVLVVREHSNQVCNPLHAHPPLFEGSHHCQQLLIIDGVVQLSRGKLPSVEAEGMQVAIIRGLRQDTAKGEVGCIGLHCEGQAGW